MLDLLKKHYVSIALALFYLLVMGFKQVGILSSYIVQLIMLVGINVVMTVSLGVVNGFTGQFSIGHAGFMAVGAYGSAFLTTVLFNITGMNSPGLSFTGYLLFLVSVLVGGILASIAGFVVGLPTLRIKGDYLAIATMAFSEVIRTIIRVSKVLGGPRGVSGVPPYTNFTIIFLFTVGSVWLMRNFLLSTYGRACRSVRDDETAAEMMGVNVTRIKVMAFTTSAFFAGCSGALFVHLQQFVHPDYFTFVKSLEYLIYLYIGGAGSISGAMSGALIFTFIPELFRGFKEWRMVAYSITLILVMLFRSDGLMGKREFPFIWHRRRLSNPDPEKAASLVPRRETTGEILIDLQGINHYFGGLKAVSNFDMRIYDGEIVGLIGPNGAGKTTVFNLITGLYKPTAGRILFKNIEIQGEKPYVITEMGIARTFQNIRLFYEMSVIENIKLAYHHREKYGLLNSFIHGRRFWEHEQEIHNKAYAILRLFGLEDRADLVASSLPYGDQRRLEIARAIATHPDLILLDEPAAGMNPAEADSLLEIIGHLRDRLGLTVLLIEHQMRVVMGICERVRVMDFGETIAEGKPEEIQNDPKVIEAYLGEEV